MNWMQVSVATTEATADVVASILIDAGAGGAEVVGGRVPEPQGDEWAEDLASLPGVTVKAYFGEDGFEAAYEDIRARLQTLRGTDEGSGTLEIAVDTVPDTDWNENFRRHFTTFRASGRVVIKPTWQDYMPEADDIVIEMDPGMAFGSGDHETTRLCLELLQKHMKTGAAVMDVGCGSGILAIAADKLGAGSVVALDYDGVSVRVARDNAAHNGANIETRRSDLLQNADKKQYDIILANIIADIVMRLNEDIRNYLAPDGVYILSGVVSDRLDEVTESLKAHGLVPVETLAQGDWRAVAARRDDAPGIC